MSHFKLAQIFADNMVLQRDVRIPIWGKGSTGSKVCIASPTAVRYNWANYAEATLYNDAELLATPFRTDKFDL